MSNLRLAMIAFGCTVVGFGTAAPAQQGPTYPSVPGPFIVAAPAWMAPGAMPNAPAAMPAPGATPGSVPPQQRLNFAPPANAMRVPYWMQPDQSQGRAQGQTEGQPQGGAAQTAPVAAAPGYVGATGPGAAAPARPSASGYGQAWAPGTFPSYGATIPWAGPAAGPTAGPGAGAGPVTPGPQGQPGYGAPPPPGWGWAPYAPGPGWSAPVNPAYGGGN